MAASKTVSTFMAALLITQTATPIADRTARIVSITSGIVVGSYAMGHLWADDEAEGSDDYDTSLFSHFFEFYPEGQWQKIRPRDFWEPYIKTGIAVGAGVLAGAAIQRLLSWFTPEGRLHWQEHIINDCARTMAQAIRTAQPFLTTDHDLMLQDVMIRYDGPWPLVTARGIATGLYNKLNETNETLNAASKALSVYAGDTEANTQQKARGNALLTLGKKLHARSDALKTVLRVAIGGITAHPHYQTQCALFEQNKQAHKHQIGQ